MKLPWTFGGPWRPADQPRLAGAAAVFGLTGACSYVAQRLLNKLLGEVPPDAVIAQVHVPFFWRVFVSGWHAAVVAAVFALAVRDTDAAFDRLTAWLPPLLVALLAACLLVP